MKSSRILFSTLVITLLAVNPTACSNSNNPESPNDDADNSQTQTPIPTSPLTALINQVTGTDLDPDEVIRRREAENVRRAELVAECMAAAGFDYQPAPGSTVFTWGDGTQRRPDDPEWVAVWGFGMTRDPGPRPGLTQSTTGGPMPQRDDPNYDYFNSLSPTEQEAFNLTLNGRGFPYPDNWDGEMTDELQQEISEWYANFSNWGCNGVAWEQTLKEIPAGLISNNEFAPLFDAIVNFQQAGTSEITDADRDWAFCMADAGHPGFDRRSDAVDSITAGLADARYEVTSTWDWTAGGNPDSFNSPILKAFWEHEVAVALADLECRNSTDFDARRAAFIFDRETQFLTDHQSEIAALNAALEQFD